MSENSQQNFRIHLVGLGLHLGHLTREVEDVLRHCRRIFFIHPSMTVQSWIYTIDADAVDASSFYLAGESRTCIYRSIAAQVLAEARHPGKPIALALYGHPLILSTLSQMILVGSEWLGLSCQVLPGISSIDSIIGDLRIDPGDVALQIQEATELLMHERSIDPFRGLLLLQPALAGNLRHADNSFSSPFTLIVDYLIRYYPASQLIYLVRCASEISGEGSILKIPLGDLAEYGVTMPNDFTLYVPPLSLPQFEGLREDNTASRGEV